MPPKKCKTVKQSKQQKIVTSTLLTISLEVDNYIYKKEPIPLEKANAYIEKIMKLKVECNDVRSRQVSEKLTSILKGVIDEYSNKVITTENSTGFSLNANIENKINEDFESNLALNISTVTCEALVATNAGQSQNHLEDSNNMKDQNVIPINIDDISKDLQQEGMQVDQNKEHNTNVSHNENSIVQTTNRNVETTTLPINQEIINKTKSTVKNVKQWQPPTIKKKTVCTKQNQLNTNTKCANSITISEENIIETSRNKKTISKKKQISDLTWVENVKLIREIHTDEHLVSNLEESFWSDLSKPSNCSLDFETD